MKAIVLAATALLALAAPAYADTITGTQKADSLTSTAGNDTITTKKGPDRIYFHGAFGTDHITDFDEDAGDRLVFDENGCYSDIMVLGQLYDGQVIQSCNGGHFDVHISGGSTTIEAYTVAGLQGTVVLDGVTVLYGWAVSGG